MNAVASAPSKIWRRSLPLPSIRGHVVPFVPTVILSIMVALAVLAPLIAPADPSSLDLTNALRPPAWQSGGTLEHLLGTDQLGRDVLSRLIYGARISLLVGGAAIVVAGTIGTVIGVGAGYIGGWLDSVLMRVTDAVQSIPALILFLLVAAALRPNLLYLILLLGLVSWVAYARIIRAEVLSLREREYVALARVAGASPGWIIRRHILPNVSSTIVVLATLQVGQLIIAEASLSFLGLGVQPPRASWGLMLADGRTYVTVAWWLAAFPGLMILLAGLAFNLLGDWLSDSLDPRRAMSR